MKIILFFLIFQEYIPVSKKSESNIFYIEKIKTLENANIFYPYLLPEDYKISDGDTLEIRFFGHFNGLSKRGVPKSGEILIASIPLVIPYFQLTGLPSTSPFFDTIPPLGKFYVKGKRVKEVEKEIREKLKEKYPETDVIVELISLGVKVVHLVGDIPYPGYYTVSPLTRITGVLAMGGVFENSKLKEGKIYLVRNGNKIEIDINKYIDEGDLSSNPYVENEDIIIFKRKKK